jgi:MOSC domain-containing protein YiiM
VFFIGDEVSLEATGPCEPCTRMDEIRPGLREALDGRRGITTMVLSGGMLKVGDTVRVEPSREALLAEEAAR